MVVWSWFGKSAPLAARFENLIFQIICMWLVYGISRVWATPLASLVAAAFFGFHFHNHVAVAAASWSITTAHSLILSSLLLFLRFYNRDSNNYFSVVALSALSLAATLFYDPAIGVLPACVVFMLCKKYFFHQQYNMRALFIVFISSMVTIVVYVIVRVQYVGLNGAVNYLQPAATALKNAAAVFMLLFVPADPLLLHEWFKVPLLSREWFGPGLKVAAVAVSIAFVLLILNCRRAVNLVFRAVQRIRMEPLLFCAICAAAYLAPVFGFSQWVSFASLHFPLALLSVCGASLLTDLGLKSGCSMRMVFMLLLLFLVCSISGIYIRNRRVHACGATAYAILSNIQGEMKNADAGQIGIAPAANSLKAKKFSFYNLSGLDVLGLHIGKEGVQGAIRWFLEDKNLSVFVGEEGVLPEECKLDESKIKCFIVLSDGEVCSAGQQRRE